MQFLDAGSYISEQFFDATLGQVAVKFSEEQKVDQALLYKVDLVIYAKDLDWYNHTRELCPNHTPT